MMERITTDILVLGSGGAGLLAATVMCPCGTHGPRCAPLPLAAMQQLSQRRGSVGDSLGTPPALLQGLPVDSPMGHAGVAAMSAAANSGLSGRGSGAAGTAAGGAAPKFQ